MNRKTDPEGLDSDSMRESKPSPWCVEHHEDLKSIWHCLFGNGTPEHGIKWKIETMLDRQQEVISALNELRALKQQIIDSNKFVTGFKRILWGVLDWSLKGSLLAVALTVAYFWASSHGWKI